MATTTGTTVQSDAQAVSTVVPVSDTSAYAAGDSGHTNDLVFPDVAFGPGLGGIIVGLRVLVLEASQTPSGELHLFTGELTNTTHTVNAAWNLHNTDALLYACSPITFGGWFTSSNNSLSGNTSVREHYRCAPTSTNLYGVIVFRSAVTLANAANLRITLITRPFNRRQA